MSPFSFLNPSPVESRDRIVIVGSGRLGAVLANQLSSDGHPVVIIDHNENCFSKLSADFSGFKIVGSAIEIETLEEAEVGRASYLFALTTHDETNLMVAQVASEIYGVPNVVARLYDPVNEALYQGFGIETISPTQLSMEAILNLVELPE